MIVSTLGLNMVHDRLEQSLCWAAVQHAQHTGISLGGKEQEDGQHAARTDVLAVRESKSICCKREQAKDGAKTQRQANAV
jgi:hypothetical protein